MWTNHSLQLYHWDVDTLSESENTTGVIIITVGISESIYHSKNVYELLRKNKLINHSGHNRSEWSESDILSNNRKSKQSWLSCIYVLGPK